MHECVFLSQQMDGHHQEVWGVMKYLLSRSDEFSIKKCPLPLNIHHQKASITKKHPSRSVSLQEASIIKKCPSLTSRQSSRSVYCQEMSEMSASRSVDIKKHQSSRRVFIKKRRSPRIAAIKNRT